MLLSGFGRKFTMRRQITKAFAVVATAIATGALLGGCSTSPMASGAGWASLVSDGQGISNWNAIGDANWRVVDGALQADKGVGFLISKNSYSDFEIRAEFWADENANSGIFIRLSDTKTVTASNSYEVNIYDKRPDPLYGTGAIVDYAKVNPMPKAAGKWNTYEIIAKGNQLTVKLNGVVTADIRDGKHSSGPIALQYAAGVVKDAGVIRFKNVQIKAL
jgi:Domain of Unknown Function (DUF1080)